MTKLTFSFKFFCFRLQIDTYASWLIKLSEFLYFMTCDTVAALIIFFFFLKMSIIFCHHKNSMTFPFSTLSNLVNLSPNSSQKKKKKALTLSVQVILCLIDLSIVYFMIIRQVILEYPQTFIVSLLFSRTFLSKSSRCLNPQGQIKIHDS
jgi:hypothetical protein